MKKAIKMAALLLAAVCTVCSVPALEVSASKTTSYTYTLNEKGEYIRTQDAYLPERTVTDLGLSSPQDLFVDGDNNLYIVDGGNKRIAVYDIAAGRLKKELAYEGFAFPKGICVTKDGEIYVADTAAKAVFHFDKNFNHIETFTKPETPAFADTNFEPAKIAVDDGKNLYVISEGVYNGVIQLAHTGEFLGYFAVNDANLTMAQRIRRAFATRAQIANLIDAVPDTFSNLFVDKNGIVYTTTMGSRRNGLKKHNTAGGNMFVNTVFGRTDMTDVWVDDFGIIYTSGQNGNIEVFSKQGELIFQFGSFVTTYDVAGLFASLPAVAVDKNGYIWCVDGEKGYLQSFAPTEYATMVYEAMDLYETGFYEQSMDKWNQVLRLNQMSVLAHDGVGKAYLRAGEYREAMTHFEVSGNRKQFSEAFWEVRNEYIQKWMPVVFYCAVVLFILFKVIKKLDKKQVLRKKRQSLQEKIKNVPVLKDVLFAFTITKHPVNQYYEIRKHRKGSVLGATILYAVFFVIFMLYQTSKGFIYQFTAVEDLDINGIVVGFFAILFLFILCNYLVTSINDGDGSFAQVYMIPAYGTTPLLMSMAGTILLSYVFTYNESFLLTLIMLVGGTLSVISVFTGLQTVHDYSGKETVKSLLMTAVFMIIAAVVAIIVIILWERLYQFLFTVVQEVIRIV